MIVRILGEGQLDVPDREIDQLNVLDDRVQRAVDAGDQQLFAQALGALLAQVRAAGQPLPHDVIVPSELVLPSADSSLAEVRALIGDEGLVPG